VIEEEKNQFRKLINNNLYVLLLFDARFLAHYAVVFSSLVALGWFGC
jgi:hypothetical protein